MTCLRLHGSESLHALRSAYLPCPIDRRSSLEADDAGLRTVCRLYRQIVEAQEDLARALEVNAEALAISGGDAGLGARPPVEAVVGGGDEEGDAGDADEGERALVQEVVCLAAGRRWVGGGVELEGGDGQEEADDDGEQGAANQGEAHDYGYADDRDGDPLREHQRWVLFRPRARRPLRLAPFFPLAGAG